MDEKSGSILIEHLYIYVIYILFTEIVRCDYICYDILTLPVFQIQMREKWRAYYGHKWLDLATCGATDRWRSRSLQPIRTSQTCPSYLGPRHAYTSAQGKPGHRHTRDADGFSQCRSSFWTFCHIFYRCSLHILRSYIG